MSPRYLYALLGAAPTVPLGAGLAGEPVQVIACGGIVAATGAMPEVPAVSPDALRGHDAVVRRLADVADAILPARFGMLAADDRELCERLARAPDAVRDALRRVAGRAQMILRVYATSPAPPRSRDEPDRVPPTGPRAGTEYLAARARRQRATAEVAELRPLRAVLARFVVDERIERHERPPLVASAYHLVARGEAAQYTTAVEDAARALEGVRVRVSGPWAPYAFAPDLV